MNSIDEHLGKARHNLAFLNSIDVAQDTFADWAVVVLFYRALHLVSAYAHARGTDHGANHQERLRILRLLISEDNYNGYQRLYNRARLVRYEELSATSAEYHYLLQRSFEPLLRELEQRRPDLFR